MRRLFTLFLLFLSIGICQANVFNVKDYGAKGDGVSNDQKSINDAIWACYRSGGGKVLFQDGVFLTSTIHLESDVTILIKENAKIVSTKDGHDSFEFNPCQPDEFHKKRFEGNYQDFGHSHYRNALFYARKKRNIKIIGEGKVDYQYSDINSYPHHIHIDANANKHDNFVPAGIADKCFSIVECENVEIKNINGLGGGHFMVLFKDVSNFNITNCWFDADRDGMNIVDCKNGMIKRCFMEALDDGYCLKSDYGTCRKLWTDNITFDSCVVLSKCWAMKFGRSESYNDVKNVTYSNITVLEGAKGGVAILNAQGADMTNITFKNITMENVNEPIFIVVGNTQYHMNPDDNGPGKIKGLLFENITVTNQGAGSMASIFIQGINEAGQNGNNGILEDVTFKDMKFHLNGEERMPRIEEWNLPWIKFSDPQWSGMYLNWMDGVSIENVHYTFQGKNTKPLMLIENCENVTIRNTSTDNSKDSKVDIIVDEVKNISVKESKLKMEEREINVELESANYKKVK